MSSLEPFLFYIIIIILFYFEPSISVEICRTQCGSQTIRSPFRLIDQPQHCGYQGFELYCTQDLPILNLPYSGNFTVFEIDYAQQILIIDYSEGCIPRILLQGRFNLSGCPFMSSYTQSFIFYNCSTSTNQAIMVQSHGVIKIPCLSGLNFNVLAIPTTKKDSYIPSTCSEIANVSIPISVTDLWENVITLEWKEPDCRWCQSNGRTNNGLSTSVKYALLLGLATPLVCLVVIISCFKIHRLERQNHPSADILMTSVTLSRPTLGPTNGLDRRTIDAYPTTSLGPNRCLLNPNDNVCSICLCDYQANEMLRTIPNCSHYFHVDCIDQWLKLNTTCPICRVT